MSLWLTVPVARHPHESCACFLPTCSCKYPSPPAGSLLNCSTRTDVNLLSPHLWLCPTRTSMQLVSTLAPPHLSPPFMSKMLLAPCPSPPVAVPHAYLHAAGQHAAAAGPPPEGHVRQRVGLRGEWEGIHLLTITHIYLICYYYTRSGPVGTACCRAANGALRTAACGPAHAASTLGAARCECNARTTAVHAYPHSWIQFHPLGHTPLIPLILRVCAPTWWSLNTIWLSSAASSPLVDPFPRAHATNSTCLRPDC